MSHEEKSDLIVVLRVGAVVLPLALLGGLLVWFLCWGGYWWPEVFPWLA